MSRSKTGRALGKMSAPPERRCILTGQSFDKNKMFRFVISPDGLVIPDVLEKLPGRGIWLMPGPNALNEVTAKSFSRAAKRPVQMPDNLAELVKKQVTDHTISLLSLANRAGQAVAGFEKCAEWLKSGKGHFVMHASDGSEQGLKKLRSIDSQIQVISLFDASQLARAFGREHVVHAVIANGGLAERILQNTSKIELLGPEG